MKSVHRILNHVPTIELNLNQSTIGKSCLKSLTSSQHRIRLLASRSLMKFFPDAKYEQLTTLRENSQTLRDHFSQLINSDHSEYQETYIATLGNLSKVADKTLLSYILQVLLECLGHKNLFVRTLSYQAIRNVAKLRQVTELELFKPFWNDLSIFIIEKLETNIDLVKQVVTMLRMSVKDFLDQTLEHTLPHLVFKKKVGTLEALAKILDRDVPVMCINEIHHILGFLFMQEESDIHEAIMFFLSIASSDFNNITMTSLLKSCSLLLVVKLAIELGDEEEGRRLKALAALRLVESKLRNEIPQDPTMSEDSLSAFLRHYFLGVLSHINESINDLHRNQSAESKLKTVRSLGSLISLIGHSIYPLTPQIMATLQTILDHPSLRTEALKVWKTFIHILDLEHLGPLLNQVIVILINTYSEASSVERKEIVTILNYLFVEKREQLQQYFHTVRLLPDIPEFSYINNILGDLKGNVTVREQFIGVLELILHENPIVVHQALVELKRLLDENQEQIYSLTLAETVDPLVNNIIRVLLETCTRFNGSNLEIQLVSAECLGIIGAVDPGRLDISLTEESVIVVNNFDDTDESIDFVCNFIEKQLVGAFRSARDTKLQSHLAFTIQELLKFCGFSSELVSESPRTKINTRVRRRWDNFPRTVHETITPLLDAKYSINYISNKVYSYPIYPVKQTFKEWLQSWTIDLISKVRGENARKIFSVCRNIVKTGNTNIALYLLPHLVLNILISGNDVQREEILTEVLSVLKDNSKCRNQQPSEKQQLGAQILITLQTVFSLVDHLTKWIRLKRQRAYMQKAAVAKRAGRFMMADDIIETDSALVCVEPLLSKIPQDIMSEASYHCNANARALMHFELHIRNERKTKSETELQPLYEQLQKIYARIDEPDGMDGISTKFHSYSIDQQILEHEQAGKWSAAQICYEISLQKDSSRLDHQIGLLNCLKNLGLLESMLTHVNGVKNRFPEWQPSLNAFAIETAWRLGKWDTLQDLVQQPSEDTFESKIGQLLLCIRHCDEDGFQKKLRIMREKVIAPLAVASMESYRRAYEHLVKLHMLYELETSYRFWFGNNTSEPRLNPLLKHWDSRLDITLPTFKVKEPILNLRRILLQISNQECGNIWLQSAKVARKAGYNQTAYNALLHADQYQVPFSHIEKAKWLWDKNEKRKAIQELRNALSNHENRSKHSEQDSNSEIFAVVKDLTLDSKSTDFINAKTNLLLAKWMEQTSLSDYNAILSKYGDVITNQPQWEKGFFYLGRYYNKLYENERVRKSLKKGKGQLAGLLFYICKNYGRALTFGTKYIYQTLPRLLTLWLDFGANTGLQPEPSNSGKAKSPEDRSNKFHLVNKMVRRLNERLPAYQFLTAFPQIISRICHRNKNVFEVLELIIMNVLTAYPQQALWSVMSVSRSTYKIRANRCNAILAKVKSNPKESPKVLDTLVPQAIKLTDQLLGVCNYPVSSRETTLSINRDFRTLQRMTPLKIIVPLQSTLTVTLPANSQTLSSHNPFPSEQPVISGFQDEVEIMHSLQKPRKIVMIGDNKKEYTFLCKPKDDLRKDTRLMEFNSMINKLLKKDPESRKRGLHIRTYAVVPLNEECGLIEWVPNTAGLRHILLKIYKAKNIMTPISQIRSILDIRDRPGPDVFTKILLPKFPPVFYEWFLETFPEPTSWFSSRVAYATTAAVMSMVGYVLGLGDRHGENILFDATNGDTVHVDFNCLFEKGLTFDVPEKVPFRLTQNMVDAFGVTGYEGVFRKSCEVSLRLLRNNRESLMCVLETFIHDPLCEWSKKKQSSMTSGEVENEHAVRSLQTIDQKLQGLVQAGFPLSIEGQVDELIRQATDAGNLFKMYIGWAAYM
ncbi:hypothetical protein K493DRAFT_288711 [Basidiobolus meristosporus CBS 931.73]|uniref:non-specific serine/threonine protein kinase n=1 Tax=Basidiobolus meristosporus CBS 931.73 TaxID=1314790 RepID=A0A1Y1XWP1_9FUNG|nr:hypothetical protein K493DRAFT_288711 [Basidiobolus meristosporus CBS 931.73]|eukprot:ORX89906.1 hypothetical protein K493DRAFT_288711 [Basidiobolus meristosporus CBS 931.73]